MEHLRLKKPVVFSVLLSRILLFVIIQSLFALIIKIFTDLNGWEKAADLWPYVITVVNILLLIVLTMLFKKEDDNYWKIFRFNKETVKKDLISYLIVLAILAPIAFLPNILLGEWLFGSSEASLDYMLRPMSKTAAYITLFLFPITQGLVEIPLYFVYVKPRLTKLGYSKVFALVLPAIFLSLQHIAMPLVFDINYLVWRALMYLPFAFFIGIVLEKRQTLLPYLLITHVLMDMSLGIMLILRLNGIM
jgi:hypothetical protein